MLISSTHLCSISSVHDRQIRLLGVSPEVIALVSLMSESRQPKAAVHCHGPYKHAADLRSHRTAPVGQQRHAVRHARGAVRSTIVRSGGSRSHWKRSLWSPKWPSPASAQPPLTNTVRISTVPTSVAIARGGLSTGIRAPIEQMQMRGGENVTALNHLV
jgi:hypothetical protein